jgi:hypothetical protein
MFSFNFADIVTSLSKLINLAMFVGQNGSVSCTMSIFRRRIRR